MGEDSDELARNQEEIPSPDQNQSFVCTELSLGLGIQNPNVSSTQQSTQPPPLNLPHQSSEGAGHELTRTRKRPRSVGDHDHSLTETHQQSTRPLQHQSSQGNSLAARDEPTQTQKRPRIGRDQARFLRETYQQSTPHFQYHSSQGNSSADFAARDEPTRTQKQRARSLTETHQQSTRPLQHQSSQGNSSAARDKPRRTHKRQRMIWYPNLQNRFIDAINHLEEKATATQIMRYMNIPGLTRENIASHLQKYREYRRNLKKNEGVVIVPATESQVHSNRAATTATTNPGFIRSNRGPRPDHSRSSLVPITPLQQQQQQMAPTATTNPHFIRSNRGQRPDHSRSFRALTPLQQQIAAAQNGSQARDRFYRRQRQQPLHRISPPSSSPNTSDDLESGNANGEETAKE